MSPEFHSSYFLSSSHLSLPSPSVPLPNQFLSLESRRSNPPPSLNVNKGVKLLSGSSLWFMREMFALFLCKFSILQDKTQPRRPSITTVRAISGSGLKRLHRAKLASCGGSPREFLHLWQLANPSVLARRGLREFNVWIFSRATRSKNNYKPLHAVNRPVEAIGVARGAAEASCFPPVMWAGKNVAALLPLLAVMTERRWAEPAG